MNREKTQKLTTSIAKEKYRLATLREAAARIPVTLDSKAFTVDENSSAGEDCRLDADGGERH